MKKGVKKSIAYIIPGNLESHKKQPSYNKIAILFESKGIVPVHVKIEWKKNKVKSFNDYNQQFLKLYKRPKSTAVYILGFSFGALIAFLTTADTKPEGLILCSLSPYFEEDLVSMRQDWLKYWEKYFPYDNFSFNKLVKKVKCKTYVIVGDKESTWSLTRARELNKMIKGSEIFLAKDAEHKINQKEYLKTVEKVIARLQ